MPTDSSRAVVSVGMPVYNGERTLRAAVQALLGQTFSDFELVISDNCSTDATESICLEFAARDSRIRYIRQPENRGADANFRAVFEQARGKYFMWAAADDNRSADFLEGNLAFLAANSDFVGSTSPVRFRDGDFDEIKMGDRTLSASEPAGRILDFLTGLHANGRFYSLYRRQVVASWPHLQDSRFLGADWTLVAHAASVGKLKRLDTGWVEFGRGGMSNTVDIFRLFRDRPIDWVLPFRRMSSDILEKVAIASPRIRLAVFRRLAALNAWAFVAQFVVWYRRRSSARGTAAPSAASEN